MTVKVEDGFRIIKFKSNHDFELGKLKEERVCEYKIHNAGENKGLVVYIPGFGGDLGNYTEVFCKKISEKYNLASMSVKYFCMFSRPEVGAGIRFEIAEQMALNRLIHEHGETPCGDIDKDLRLLNELCKSKNKQTRLLASLIPKNDEYQNFGVLPALDIFNAIRDAVRRYNLDKDNIFLIGSSYGGYIANLVTKICPGYIRAVFDNSSWAKPNLNYVVGRELHTGELNANMLSNVQLGLCVKSPWTLVSGLPNSFEKSKMDIRSFNRNQLSAMADNGARGSTFYCFYHSANDGIAPTLEKIEMKKNMSDLGFNVHMKVVEETDVDGVFIKDLSHGLGMSMIQYFDKCFSHINDYQHNFNSESPDIVSYEFEECRYQFDLSKSPVEASIMAA